MKALFVAFFHAFFALFGPLYDLFGPLLTLFNEKKTPFLALSGEKIPEKLSGLSVKVRLRGEEEKEKNWYGQTNRWMYGGSTRGPWGHRKSRFTRFLCVKFFCQKIG